MISHDIIEEHPLNEPAPMDLQRHFHTKARRVTLDARNVNKAVLSTNLPIPRHEDIKAKLSGCKFFSKLDEVSASSVSSWWKKVSLAPLLPRTVLLFVNMYVGMFITSNKWLKVLDMSPTREETS